MDKKGYTLIELLVVIALVAVLTTSITIAGLSMLKSQQETLSDLEIENIENAACLYADLNDLRNGCSDSPVCEIQVQTLIDNGFLDDDTAIGSNSVTISWDPDGLKSCTYN